MPKGEKTPLPGPETMPGLHRISQVNAAARAIARVIAKYPQDVVNEALEACKVTQPPTDEPETE